MVKRAAARWAMAALLAAVAACRTVPVTPPAPPAPPRPALDKTFGALEIRPNAGAALAYKDLRLAVDPPAAQLAAAAAQLDFVLFTEAVPAMSSSVRRDLKVMGPPEAAEAARRAGFSNAKALGTGQRLMLSKPGAFVFVTAVQARHAVTGKTINAYLLEFDNGRNIFLSGDLTDVAALREFVYGLRDDGKELDIALVSVGPPPAKADEPLPKPSEGVAAEITALLAPRIGVLINEGGASRERLSAEFGNQIMSGDWYLVNGAETAPF